MAERPKFRLLREEPVVALRLRERRPTIIPEDLYNWAIDWVSDIGKIMRSRSYMAGTLAHFVSIALISTPFVAFPELKRLKFLARTLGVR